MSEEKKSLSTAVKEALAKKHAAAHPDVKTKKDKSVKKPAGPAAMTAKPMRKAAGRGG